MAPSALTSTGRKRKHPTFSPPRPKASKSSNPNGATKRRGRPPGSTNSKKSKHASQKHTSHASRTPSTTNSLASSPPIPSPTPPATSSNDDDEPDYILAEITTNEADATPPISHNLIQRIMHQAYREPEKTLIAKDAKALVGKYVEIFVKEAIARSVHERMERDVEGGGGDGWLEVEDLERCAPQLILDF